jgi:hypothetical protein
MFLSHRMKQGDNMNMLFSMLAAEAAVLGRVFTVARDSAPGRGVFEYDR